MKSSGKLNPVSNNDFLRVEGRSIVDAASRPVILKGVNLGGWLMMEGYIMHARNIAEQVFKKDFAAQLGPDILRAFEKYFRDHFIRESDLKIIAGLGLNCVRVPFHHRLIERKPYQYDQNGVGYLDRVLAWAKRYKIRVILDLHGACGSQNYDWHSDSLGQALLWKNKSFQKRTLALWEFLADRYKDNFQVAGYDLLNESVLEDTKLLNGFYKQLIATIRAVDRRHILFVEGNKWATDIDCLDNFTDDNIVLSIHVYHPADFTFNFVPYLHYPLSARTSQHWNRNLMRKMLKAYHTIAKERNRPILVGEFGVNARQGIYGEDQWVKDMLVCFAEFGFHWTYWTYKAIKNSTFPDGLFSYLSNPPWVNRAGPRLGWDNYRRLWKEYSEEIIDSWQTEHFSKNKHLLKVLTYAARNHFQPA